MVAYEPNSPDVVYFPELRLSAFILFNSIFPTDGKSKVLFPSEVFNVI